MLSPKGDQAASPFTLVELSMASFNIFISWQKLFFLMLFLMKTIFLKGEGAYDILFSSKLWLNSMSYKAVMSQFYKLVLRKD